MHRSPILSTLFLCSLVLACKPRMLRVQTETKNAAASDPFLSIEGARIVNSKGQTKIMHGVSSNDTINSAINEEHLLSLSIMGANLVRFPFEADDEESMTTYNQGLSSIKASVDHALNQNFYVIVAFHQDGNPDDNKTAKAQALRFFRDIVSTYGPSGRVIYEIWNEPNDKATWEELKKYSIDTLKIIRATEKKLKLEIPGLTLVPTPKGCTDLSEPASEPLEDPNVAYTYRFYAQDQQFDTQLRTHAASIPVVVTQWSPYDARGKKKEFDIDSNLILFENWLEDMGISWAAWAYSDVKNSSHSWLNNGRLLASPRGPQDLTSWGNHGRSVLLNTRKKISKPDSY